jgi:hypothetical protein
MPLKKERFSIVQDNMVDAIDIDDSRGRSVPINMNFVENGYLTKDTGFTLSGATETDEIHSIYNFEKKDGTSYFLRAKGTKIQKYNTTTSLWEDTTKTITLGARFGYVTDSAGDIMYASNTVDTVWSYNGTTFTDVVGIPKGNILEIFEDKLYVAGVTAEPRSVYYSNSGVLGTFTGTDVFKPLGTDKITGLENYYGFLLVFKEKSIWKISRVQDSIGTYYNKQELQSGNYGACSRKAITWVENDIWFFTGREVRAFGFKDQQTGVLGINTSVISEAIKETLYTIPEANLPYVACWYNNRRFYLTVGLSLLTPTLNNTIFVCHTLYANSWTKYDGGRDKSKSSELFSINNTMYSIKNTTPYAVLKWDETKLEDNGVAITGTVTFKKVEDKDFNLFNIYRYLDLMFKNLQSKIQITIYQDKSDIRTSQGKQFYIGLGTEDELATVGEVDFGENLWADGFGQSPQSSPFIKRRISFLSKAQSLTIQLTNSGYNEAFTIVQFAINGFKEEKKTFAPEAIISIK